MGRHFSEEIEFVMTGKKLSFKRMHLEVWEKMVQPACEI